MAMQFARWVGSALFLVSTLPATAQSITPVPHLDLTQFTGVWFQIARLPDKAEKHCVGDASILYALGDKPAHFQSVATCKLKDDSTDVRNASGKQEKSGSGLLKVSYLFFLSRKLDVLAVAPDFTWSLVGTPNHKMLWILARTPKLDPTLLSQIESQAAAQGFNTARLIQVSHTP